MGKPDRTIDGLPARRAALHAFAAVLKGAGVDAALAAQAQKGLDANTSDRGFARALLLALLRGGFASQARLAPFLPDAASLPPVIHHLLWLGDTQLTILGTPAHAVLSTATELAKGLAGGRYAPLVNAVLRKATTLPPLDPLDALAPWLRARWTATYGEAAVARIAAQLLVAAPLDLTVKAGAAVEGRALFGGMVRLPAGTDPLAVPGFAAGDFWVQDAAAALPLALHIQGTGNLAGRTALDIGAAPGGKTAQLYAAGANVTALDLSANRMARLAENMARLGFAPTTVSADARDYAPDGGFNLVVLDAPCSATGTLRRHPELAWQKGEGDVLRLAALQADLLPRAAALVALGGTLLFLTCSLEPEEGEAQAAAFLASQPDWRVAPFPAPPFGRLTDAGALRLLPSDLGTMGGNDGFYAVRLVRR